MATQPDNHTLNACLARVIGLRWGYDPELNEHGYFDADDNFRYQRDEWDPLQNASQMELVEAWVVRDYNLEYARYLEFGLWDCHIWKDGFSVVLSDPDKKHAFALAIQAMEQSQEEQ